jgi:hypothetical protein
VFERPRIWLSRVFRVSAVSRICGPIYLQCEQLHFKFVVNQSRDSRSARYSRGVFAETSSHRRLDQLIQIAYLRSAGVSGAVNLLGTTSLTVQELSGLLVHDVYYKCQYGINSSTRSKGRTYRVRQTQACPTLQNQVNRSQSNCRGRGHIYRLLGFCHSPTWLEVLKDTFLN